MAQKKGEVTDVVRRMVRFLTSQYGAYNVVLDTVTVEFTIKRGKHNEGWQNENSGRIHAYLDDVRVTTIMFDREPDKGEQREIDAALFKCMTED